MRFHRYIITLIACSMFGLIGCNDDFLERGPMSRINDALFWQSPNDLQVYVNNLYSQHSLLPNYNASYYDRVGLYTQDAFDGSDLLIRYDYHRRMNGENQISAAGGWSTGDWALLRNINYFLTYYNKVDADFSLVSQYVGEALFFRSIFYFNKLKQFGALPWAPNLLDPSSDELFDGREPRNEIVAYIMEDLDRAVEYLGARGNSGWTGRVTKETALALQARIALYEGTWEKYHLLKATPFSVPGLNGQQFLAKAVEAAEKLMMMAAETGYPALDNVGQVDGYWNLFNQKDYAGSKEVLFWRKYQADPEYLSHRWNAISYTGAGVGITKRLVDLYLCSDGRPTHLASGARNPLYQGDEDLIKVTTNRDPRLNQTLCVPDGLHYRWKPDTYFETPSVSNSVSDWSTICVTGFQMYKGHSADRTEYDALSRRGTTGCIYFRYAEVLLIYAEAKAELGTITQNDIDRTINALRTRVGMTNGLLNIANITTDPNWLFPTTGPAAVSPLIQEIRRERTVELACEGFRVDDIFRWAAAEELIVGYQPKGAKLAQWPTLIPNNTHLRVDAQGYMDPFYQYIPARNGYQFKIQRDYLQAIPTNELTINPSLRPQNPGW